MLKPNFHATVEQSAVTSAEQLNSLSLSCLFTAAVCEIARTDGRNTAVVQTLQSSQPLVPKQP
jgi:hypothetical protein